MKKIGIVMLSVMVSMSTYGQRQMASYLSYIEQWKNVAIRNQADYGIPASIIMAQALLESGAGLSELAVEANNHFGIKCTSEWFGGVYYHDDDSKGECFRQYKDAADSFKDHALFLQRPRYATCFEIAVEDYEGWAFRLKQCGYATDNLYPQKLIKIIEDYRLDTLVGMAPVGERDEELVVHRGKEQRPAAEQPKQTVIPGSAKKATTVIRAEPIAVISQDPEPPYEEPLTASKEKKLFLILHPKKKCNGVSYVEAREGDTYANVAFRLNVKERTLREQNDALGRDMKVGDRIYLKKKRKQAPQVKAVMWVHPGEELWAICQREGVQLKEVQKLNGFEPSLRRFKTRQQIYLAKVKE